MTAPTIHPFPCASFQRWLDYYKAIEMPKQGLSDNLKQCYRMSKLFAVPDILAIHIHEAVERAAAVEEDLYQCSRAWVLYIEPIPEQEVWLERFRCSVSELMAHITNPEMIVCMRANYPVMQMVSNEILFMINEALGKFDHQAWREMFRQTGCKSIEDQLGSGEIKYKQEEDGWTKTVVSKRV